jgi:DNA-directed RNA polymerase specialized sigma subunit
MEYGEKIEWLKRYRAALKLENETMEEVERLRVEAERVTQSLSGIPGGTSDGQTIPRAVERIIEAQGRLTGQVDDGKTVRAEIVAAIERVQPEICQRILKRRYVLGQRWEKIADVEHLSRQHVMRLHKKAVKILEPPEKEES